MEFLTILIIFAILSRIFEALGGGRKGPGTRPPQPGQRLPQQRRRPLPGSTEEPEGSPAAAEPRDAAAEMIPDELWELLTGQKRQRPAPPPVEAPAPAPVRAPPAAPVPVRAGRPPVRDHVDPERPGLDEEAEAAEYVRRHRRDEAAEVAATLDRQRTTLARRAPEHVVKVVSLETEPLPEAQRHRRFHEKIDRPAPAAAPSRSAAQRLGLTSSADLRRAFILREVLGAPRGLEEEAPDR